MVAVIVRTGANRDQAGRQGRGVAGHHHDGHRLADGASDPEHDRRQNARTGRRERYTPNGLPAGCAEQQSGVTVRARDGVEGIFGDGNHRRDGDCAQQE